jgi:two-component system, chemotaxis family, sensor kinase CheA
VSQFSDSRGAELRELFFETAQELLQSLNEEALKLEKHPGDLETVRSIRRIVHTLKGDAAASGCHELSELAHELEDALALDAAASHASLAEIALDAADTFEAMLGSYRSGAELPLSESLRKTIRRLARDPKVRKSRPKKPLASGTARTNWTEYEKLAMQEASKQGKQVYHLTVQIDPHCAMPIAARQLVLKAMGEVGEVLGTRPEAGSAESAKRFQLLLVSGNTTEYLTAKCRIPTIVSQVKVETITPLQPSSRRKSRDVTPHTKTEEDLHSLTDAAPAKATKLGRTPSSPPADNTPAQNLAPAENILRVEAERIDTVLNLVGELIIGKSMLQQALNEFSKHYPKEAMRGRFADAIAFQARALTDLQRSVMKVRMVPVEQLFRRFPRMVRDVAKQCGKQVDLVLNGQNTDLDKGLLDSIAEPLTHLVRNAIGHGIEDPKERTQCGKPACGMVRLDAYHQGNQFIVEVSDDGRGIDVQKVTTRAVERGLLSREEAARLSEADILELIFRPGFSTADEVTEIAGRGVGLDVVQSVLHRLKGTVEVTTRPGQGTTFRLQLPLTLAIIKALLFRVEQRLYAIPLSAVAEIARARESDLHQVDNCEVLQLRNHVLPVLRLGRPAEDRPDRRSAKIFALVIAMGERKLGLLVNALEGEEELVIKALDDQTVETDLVSGASILGDGRVVLILNLAALVGRFAKSRPNSLGAPAMGLLLSRAERVRIATRPMEAQP